MKDEGKTKEELICELVKLRQRVVVLDAAEGKRKQAEETLCESENMYITLLENLPQKVFHKDKNLVYISCNENYARDLKIKPEEIRGKTDYEFFPKGLAEKYRADDKRIITSGNTEEIEEKYLEDGQEIWVHSVKTPIKDNKGHIIGVLGILWDVTRGRRAEHELRASEERYRTLAENVADGLAILHEKKVMFANGTLSTMIGYTFDQRLGADPVVQIRDDYKAHFRETLELHEERLQRENIKLRSNIKDRYRLGNIVGKSPAMQEVYNLILMASTCDSPVVIFGETGAGKEIIARTIHEMSERHGQAFVPVNCGAIPETLFESEFFGHQKGAFTGAYTDTQGFVASASGGTLFLDEVGELSPKMQVKLLRVVEDGGYTPVGDTKTRKADVRIVAATHKNLSDMVEKGSIRQDFFYRIHVIPITVPPLRDRREDILLLIAHFMNLYGKGQRRQAIPGKILDTLYNHDWPGNVRELENVLKRYLTIKRLEFITPTPQSVHIGQVLGEGFDHQGKGLRDALKVYEKELIFKALKQNRWHRAKTAAMLDIPKRTLYRKMKQMLLIMA